MQNPLYEIKKNFLSIVDLLSDQSLQQLLRDPKVLEQADLANLIDSEMVRRTIKKCGYHIQPLANPFHYRGDTRSPDVIFNEGFCRKKEVPVEIDGQKGESYGCVAATRSLIIAVGFADCPLHLQRDDLSPSECKKLKPTRSWVYLFASNSGIDLTNTYLGKAVQEVTMLHVPPDQILAAIEIATTLNHAKHYYKAEYRTLYPPYQWQIKITDLKINTKFTLDTDSKQVLSEFRNHYERGYFLLPDTPQHKINIRFNDTWDMDAEQLQYYEVGYSRMAIQSGRLAFIHLLLAVRADELGLKYLPNLIKDTSEEILTDITHRYGIDFLMKINTVEQLSAAIADLSLKDEVSRKTSLEFFAPPNAKPAQDAPCKLPENHNSMFSL